MPPKWRLRRIREGCSAIVRFDTDVMVHGGPETLFAAEVLFGRLDADMAEQELDLFQLASCYVAEASARSALCRIPDYAESDTQSAAVTIVIRNDSA